MTILVLGLGNPLVANGEVGLLAATELKPRLASRDDVEVDTDHWGGLWLMERMIGYDRVFLIDTVCTGATPGTVHQLTPSAMPTQQSISAHDVNLPAALKLGRQAGKHLPQDENILLVGVEARDLSAHSKGCDPAAKAAVAQVVKEVIQALAPPKEEKKVRRICWQERY